ncbi:probable salivary secreted peptide [Drosophila grimshawi]|uniref:GH21960 n=1 Tax=Drosophila grimshawi TaxID=7222 RepID=B4J8T5_DROGR|nr:probable salivary secreted peptide [Drosophila grimshawi]EDW02375.1 GH21960 [Drosophila grimshawi]
MAKTINTVTLLGLFICCALVTSVYGGNDYLWGEIGPNDYHLAKDTVSKAFFVGLVQTKKYVFKQKNDLNALTITAIKVTDKKKSNGATAVLTSGGPGSKGATIVFTSERGSGIKDLVEIWGR